MKKKTQTVKCGECGKPYKTECYDLDLNVGDVVIYESLWKGVDASTRRRWAVTITNVTHKKDGVYFGTSNDPIENRLLTNVRVDTRNYKWRIIKDKR
jgi:hypothetical protein